jgi:hypothetical protein
MLALDSAGRVGVSDLGGAISVDDNGGSLTVDGTVAATQSGTWNVGTVTSVTNVVHVDDNSGTLSIDDGAGSITVDNAGTFAVQATVAAAATNIAKAEDAASADGDVGVPALAVRKATPANTSGTDGDYEFLQMSAGRLWTSSTIDAALPAGTNAIGKLAANSGVDIGDVDVTSVSGTVTVGGTAATDAAVSGNPLLAGGRASTTKPTAMSADGDAVPLWLTLSGAMVTSSLLGLTSTLSNVAASATSVSLLSSNTARRSVTIVNDSASICRVKEGTTASATSFTWLLQPYDTLILDGQYSGAIDAIWDTATGSARITERA